MVCTNKTSELPTRRVFARSRLEAEYLGRSYELIVPKYGRRYSGSRTPTEKQPLAYPIVGRMEPVEACV